MPTERNPRAASCRKSSYSGGNNGDCVQIADSLPGIAAVRDSKTPEGPATIFSANAWTSFVSAARTHEFPAA
ncbi:DUF397 domain-containing protein [Streptomyces sp. NPDC088725]|uniref:DUF397 domain-containing protein n=1 Tax=Streptomyces sp. NPDC088725 TaxID=3365873 RepID=UPI003819681D